MQLMKWNPSMSVGIKEIDLQHQKLIDILNKLTDAMQVGKSKEILNTILEELVQYGKEHFANEEKIFKDTQYPMSKSHIEEHQKFMATAFSLLKDVQDNKASLSITTMHFIKDWITNHIMQSDMGYSEHFKKAGYK